MKDLKNLLISLGFENQEAAVYLTALELGTTPASRIAKIVGIPRSTGRFTCEQLVKKQMMISAQKGNATLYTAENPEKLKKLIDLQREDVQHREDWLNKALEELRHLYNPYTVLPKVTFYEGLEGLKKAYEVIVDDLEKGDEIVTFAKILDEAEDQEGKIWKLNSDFIKKRVSKKAPIRIIATHSKAALKMKSGDSTHLRETRMGHSELFDFPSAEITVYKDKIVNISKNKNRLFVCIIQSQNLFDMQKAIFEIAWKQAKKDDAELAKKRK